MAENAAAAVPDYVEVERMGGVSGDWASLLSCQRPRVAVLTGRIAGSIAVLRLLFVN